MTLSQFMKITKQVLKSINADLLRDAERMFKSGGIDTTKAENDALLPKIILKAALSNHSLYLPKEFDKDVRNLRLF
jgi:hypothetical protein